MTDSSPYEEGTIGRTQGNVGTSDQDDGTAAENEKNVNETDCSREDPTGASRLSKTGEVEEKSGANWESHNMVLGDREDKDEEGDDGSKMGDHEEDEAGEVAAPCVAPASVLDSISKGGSSGTLRPGCSRGLPLFVEKALAQMMEAEGGIQAATREYGNAKKICDRRPDIFGQPGSKRRVQVKNRIHYWKKLTDEKYKAIIYNLHKSVLPGTGPCSELIEGIGDEMARSQAGDLKRPSPGRGLPEYEERTLAQMIEAEGGVRWFTMQTGNIKMLCDRRPDLFGAEGSKRRTQVRNKVNYWRNMPPEKYSALVTRLLRSGSTRWPKQPSSAPNHYLNCGLTMAPAQQYQAWSTQPGQPQPPGPLTRLYQSSSSSQALKKREALAAEQLTADMSSVQKSAEELEPIKRKFLVDNAAADYETFRVNIEQPERNGGFEVLFVADIENNGLLVNAFSISTTGDLRDFLADNYRAMLVGDREVLVEVPSLAYSFLHDQEEFTKQAIAGTLHCPYTEEAREIARKRLHRDPARRKRKVLFVFPLEFKLSNQVFSPDSRNGEIEYDLIPIQVSVTLNGKELPLTITRICWKVSVVERQLRHANPTEKSDTNPQTKGAAKLAHLFSAGTV